MQDRPADWKSVLTLTGQVALFLGIWLLCRKRPRSLRFVRAIDVAGTLLGSAVVALMPFGEDAGSVGNDPAYIVIRPDYIIILALTYILLGRSIYIPSTARRTAALALAIAPMLLVSLFLLHYRSHDPADYSMTANPEVRADPIGWAIRWTTIGAVWWTASTLLASMASRVFYGLRKEVRDARKLGQYTLLGVLGQGGMGTVYRASHALLRRPTAVKLLPPEKFGEESVARFEREVQLTALLSHPNTVRIFDYGRTPDRVFYYAMELLDGASLDRVVKVAGPLPPGRVIHIMEQIAGALVEAHGIGFIHRDIKPANIIVTDRAGVPDLVKVLDFGLVKRVGDGAAGEGALAAVTRAGSIAGTPQYMSPEAITAPDSLDARTDIYALGAVAYFLLAGVEVFKGATVLEVCSHHLHTEPLPPSKRVDRPVEQAVPADLEALVLSCLAKARDDRPGSAGALRSALRACRDAGSWTDDDAHAWWTEHGAELRAATPTREATPRGASMLAVDLARRDAPTADIRKATGQD